MPKTQLLRVRGTDHPVRLFPPAPRSRVAVSSAVVLPGIVSRSTRIGVLSRDLLLTGARDREFLMDWQGQKLSEMLMQAMLVASAVAAFAAGYALGSFQTMLLVYAGGIVLTALVTLPNWPFYNRHPLKWLDPAEAERHPRPQPVAAAASKKKPSKNHQKFMGFVAGEEPVIGPVRKEIRLQRYIVLECSVGVT
ncbi:hypothetical protein Taro_012238 [Colocasia esculenta]|uniref:Signal peptidase complex subunit 1 n=1 Tax=Colocasia esculenta TaxID=4460 RepID=A0A843U8K4_COLES|nr:hypothetical protein [Colocasia esculenta]